MSNLLAGHFRDGGENPGICDTGPLLMQALEALLNGSSASRERIPQ